QIHHKNSWGTWKPLKGWIFGKDGWVGRSVGRSIGPNLRVVMVWGVGILRERSPTAIGCTRFWGQPMAQ
ncbi:MAG TPA: hypothetical protein V6D46_08885, partial [Coleofasciculaceae cyanobacterium]